MGKKKYVYVILLVALLLAGSILACVPPPTAKPTSAPASTPQPEEVSASELAEQFAESIWQSETDDCTFNFDWGSEPRLQFVNFKVGGEFSESTANRSGERSVTTVSLCGHTFTSFPVDTNVKIEVMVAVDDEWYGPFYVADMDTSHFSQRTADEVARDFMASVQLNGCMLTLSSWEFDSPVDYVLILVNNEQENMLTNDPSCEKKDDVCDHHWQVLPANGSSVSIDMMVYVNGYLGPFHVADIPVEDFQ